MNRLFSISLISFLLVSFQMKGQEDEVIFQKADTLIFHKYIHFMESKRNSSVGDLMVQTAVYLMDSPYVGKTLEVCGNNERLVVNLRQFDCATFVESCLALTQTLKSNNPTFETYCTKLRRIRYRNGEINNFGSRLNYFSEWIANNETKANVINLTAAFGGRHLPMNLDFMTKNPSLYPPMANATIRERIRETENDMSRRASFYIPKELPANSKIRNGDILCLTTRVPGLDISHVGIAFRLGGVLYMIHASLTDRKVEITPEPFINYIAKLPKVSGYMVVRPL